MRSLPPCGKEIAQPELLEVLVAQVRLEAKHVLEIVGADLDARFADLEGCLAHRMAALLGQEDPQRRRLPGQLTRQRQAGEAAPGDQNIVRLRHGRSGTNGPRGPNPRPAARAAPRRWRGRRRRAPRPARRGRPAPADAASTRPGGRSSGSSATPPARSRAAARAYAGWRRRDACRARGTTPPPLRSCACSRRSAASRRRCCRRRTRSPPSASRRG